LFTGVPLRSTPAYTLVAPNGALYDKKSSRLSVFAWGDWGADAFVKFVKFVDQKTSRLSVLAWGNEGADAIVFVVFIVFLFGEGRGCRLFELFELSLILRSFSL
jgi:hypothetical protein